MGYTPAEAIVMFPALIVVILIGLLLKLVLGDKSLAVREIPLHIIGFTIVSIEIVKQCYRVYTGTWATWCIPLHFCSFFLVWYSLALITRGKVRQLMYFCSLTGGFIVTVFMYVAPRIILVDAAHIFWDNFNHWHAFTFHMCVVAYWIWMLMLNIYQPDHRHIKKAVMLYTAFYLVVIAGAFTFHENYTDVLYSSLPAFDHFRLIAGQFAYDTVLLGIGIAIITAVSYLANFVTARLYQRYLNRFDKAALRVKNN